MDSSLGRIKGNAIREFLLWLEQTQSDRELTRLLDTLPEEHAALLEPGRAALGILPSTWYPAELVHALLDGITKQMTPAEEERLVHDAARVTIEALMHGVQKMAFSLLVSPRRYPRVINTLWRLNYDSGRVDVLVRSARRHEGIISGWSGHHPLLCRISHQSKLSMYRAMGCHHVEVEQTSCISDGDHDCRSTVTWH